MVSRIGAGFQFDPLGSHKVKGHSPVSRLGHPHGEARARGDMTGVHMKNVLRALLAIAASLVCLFAQAADGIAFITNLKGEVAVDGAPRPMLMSELAKGQMIVVGKEAQLAVMYIQSGKEYVLKAPGDYTVGEREITSAHGMPPAATGDLRGARATRSS